MIVVAGEILVDLVPEAEGRYRAVPGGSPANVAIGLARLGVRTEMLARLGSGRFGRLLRDHLAENGVGLTYAVDAAEPITLAVVSLDEAGQASYDFHLAGAADWAWTSSELPDPLPAGTLALCTGSLALALEPGATALTALLAREHDRGVVTTVLDPNLRPALLGSAPAVRARLDEQVTHSDVVKASDADLAWLEPSADPREIASNWLRHGPGLVVVTRGVDGAYAATAGGTIVEVPAPAVPVVDTVGAGDAFTAGLVDGLERHGLLGAAAHAGLSSCSRDTLTEIVTRAVTVASAACTRAGADPPTAGELATLFPRP